MSLISRFLLNPIEEIGNVNKPAFLILPLTLHIHAILLPYFRNNKV